MNRSKSRVIYETARTTASNRGRYSEAGDTLVEVLLALIVLGLASVALLIAFSTSISASAEHRNLATYDTVLATATQVTIANIQSQPSLFSCPANLSAYPGYNPPPITLPAPYAGKYTVLYDSIAPAVPVQYWNTTSESFGPTCEANEPQLITIYIQGTSYSNSFIVDYPIGSSNALTAGGAAQLVFLQQPVGGYAGSPFSTQPIVEIVTAGGTPSTVTTDLSPVILTLSQGTGVLSGCSGNEILGVVTFSGCTIGTGGSNFVITATDGSLTPAVSNPFSVGISNFHLVFTSQPVAAASGVAFATAPVVAVENSSDVTDTSWAGTITLTLSGGALSALPSQTCAFSTLAPTTITLTPLNGTVTMPSGCAFSGGYYYNASRSPPQTATQYTMAATANPTAPTDAAVPAASNTFFVTGFGAATQIAFTSQPTGVASATATTPFSGQPTVAVEDSFGNVVTSATNPIGLAMNSGTGISVSNCNIPSPTNAGLYVFSGCEGSNYGTNLTLTASSPGLSSATSAKFNITNVASQLLFTTQPVAGDSGSALAIEPVLTIEDVNGNVVTAATTPIAFNAAVPLSGTMSSCTALVPQSGVITVANCAFAGLVGTPYTIVATSGSLTSAQSSSFTPTGPGPASQLVFTTSPVAGVSGAAFATQPIVKVEDSAHNIVTSSTAVITLTPSGGTLAACSGLTASAGVVTVSNCTFAGVVLTPYTLTATSGPLTSTPSASFWPTYAGVPSQIFLTGCSSAIATGATCMASATLKDSYGNVETRDISSILTFSQIPENGTVTGLGSPTVVAGVASNTITGWAQGLVGITVSGDSLTSNTITVTVNAPTTTAVISNLNPSVAGQSFNLTATVSVASPDTGVPTGNIEFLINGAAIGGVCGGASGVAVNGSGQATCLTSWPSVGTQTITAQYLGNAGAYYLASTSSALSQVVNMASPTLGVTAPANDTAGTSIAAASITANLTGSSGTNDVNTITFRVFGPLTTAPTTCTSGGVAAGTSTPAGNGTYATNSSFTPSVAGTYWWYVSSPLDANNNAAVSTCGSTMTKTAVAMASPTLSVTAPATGTAGTSIAAASITANLTGSSGTNDVNTITFTVFGPLTTAPTTCTSGGVAAGTSTPAGNGTYATSSSFTPSVAGTYWWYVSSPSDVTNNNAAVSTCGSTMTKTAVAATPVPALVQQVNTPSSGSVSSLTVTLPSNVTAGDTLILSYASESDGSYAPSSVTYGAQSFVKEAGNSAITGYGSSQVWALFNATAGAKIITITLSGSTYVQMADVTEWSGLNGTIGPVSNSGNTNTGTSVTAGSITTAGLDLVISAAYAGGGNGTPPTTPSGFTSLTLATGGSSLYYGGYGAYEIQTTAGAIQATWTQPSAKWSAAVASFGP
jgi:type II secretory pathway pseudopilin PulG